MIGQIPFLLKPKFELYANLNTLAENCDSIAEIEMVAETDVLWMDWVEDNKILIVDHDALKERCFPKFKPPVTIFLQPELDYYYPIHPFVDVFTACV